MAAAVFFVVTPAIAQIVLPPGQTAYNVAAGTQDITQQVTGTGGIDKTGDGNLQFSYTSAPATNYSGPTNILAGGVVGNGAGSLSANSAFNISSGASLYVLGANSIGSLSGAGMVNMQAGAPDGILTVGGDNSSTTFSGNISGTIAPGNTVRFTKTGTGTLTLTGTNIYGGITNVDGGILRAGSIAAFSNYTAYNVAGGATLDFNGFSNTINGLEGSGTVNLGGGTMTIRTLNGQPTGLNFTGTITGTGGITINRGGLTLGGTSTYSGATMVTSPSANLAASAANAFSPNSALNNGLGGLVSLQGFDQTIGSLSGNGLVELGSGRLTLGNDNTDTSYIGSITGSGGLTKIGTGTFTLTTNTGYTGATIVQAGTFIAHGTQVFSFTVAGGKLISDGTIGGLTANGGTVSPGGLVQTLTVNGNIALGAGGTYQVNVNAAGASGKIAAGGTASLGGTLQVLADNTGLYAPSTNYTVLTAANGVSGTFSSITSDLAFLTPSASYGSNAVVLTLTRNDTDFSQVAANPDQGSVADAIASTGFGNPIYNAILGASAADARNAFTAISGSVYASILSAQIEDGQGLRMALLDHLARTPSEGHGVRVWGNALSGWSGADGNGAAVGLDGDTVSLSAGADTDIGDDWRLGFTIGYDVSNLDLRDHASRARDAGGHAGLYGAGTVGNFALRAGGLFYVGTTQAQRRISFLGFSDATASSQTVDTSQVFAEAGYPLELDGWQAQPFAGLSWINAHAGAATETGGAAALNLGDASINQTYSSLGAMASKTVEAMGYTWLPSFRAAWQHGFAPGVPTRSAQLLAGSSVLTSVGAPLDRDRALLNADLGVVIDEGASFTLGYQGAVSPGSVTNGLRANLSMQL